MSWEDGLERMPGRPLLVAPPCVRVGACSGCGRGAREPGHTPLHRSHPCSVSCAGGNKRLPKVVAGARDAWGLFSGHGGHVSAKAHVVSGVGCRGVGCGAEGHDVGAGRDAGNDCLPGPGVSVTRAAERVYKGARIAPAV